MERFKAIGSWMGECEFIDLIFGQVYTCICLLFFTSLAESVLGMASGSKIIETILSYGSALFGLATVGAAAGALTVPPILIILVTLGLTNYKLGKDNDAEESEEEFKKRILDSLNDIPRLEKELQQQNAGLKLATDEIERLEDLDLSDLAENDLRRPYLILYRYLKGEFSDAKALSEEIIANQKSFEVLTEQLFQGQTELLEQQQHLIRQHHFELMQNLDELIQENQGQLDELIAMRCDLIDLNRDLQTELFRIRELLTGGPRLDLELFKYDPKNPDAIQNPYHYRSRRTPLFGREKEMQELWEFLQPTEGANGNDVKWWLWTAAGGSGKSRLALELCLKAVANGYDAGFWNYGKEFDANQWGKWEIKRPTLIVIDYVSSRYEEVRKAILSLYESTLTGGYPVRFLLLERPVSEERQSKDVWWTQFLKAESETDNQKLKNAAFDSKTMVKELRPLNYQEEEEALWKLMCVIWDETKYSHPDRDEIINKFKETDHQRRPLFAIFAAEAIAADKDIREWDPDQLADHVLQLELARWKKSGVVDEEHVNLLVYATICGGCSHEKSEELREQGLALPGFSYNLEQLQRLTRFNPVSSGKGEVAPFEPDILGELLVLERMLGHCDLQKINPDLIEKQSLQIFTACFERYPYKTILFMERCSQDFNVHEAHGRLVDICVDKLPDNLVPMNEAFFYFVMGMINQRLLRFDKAIYGYNRLLELPDIPIDMRAKTLCHRGVALASDYQYEKSVDDFSRVIEFSEVSDDVVAYSFVNRAIVYHELGQVENAIQDCTLVLQMPNVSRMLQIRALADRAMMFSHEESYELEISDQTRILEMDDASNTQKISALINRGMAHFSLGNYENCICDQSQVVEMTHSPNVDRFKALVSRGYAFTEIAQTDMAVQDFSEVINHPEDLGDLTTQAFIARASVYGKINDRDKQLRDLKKALECRVLPEDIRKSVIDTIDRLSI